MLGWLSKCWTGMGVTTAFERARLICTYADWTLPDQESIKIVLDTFRGNNPETDSEAAMNSFLTHLEQDEERKNAAFLIKHLLIMDNLVEERIFLTKIAQYNNNQFTSLEAGLNQLVSSSVRDLISSYYKYIKAKANCYSSQAFELVKKQTRQKFMQNSQSVAMLNQINTCFKIQNLILTVSDCFINGNKSPQIIQLVFSSLLKTYLFCFTVVSIALQTFINRIPTLSKRDLEYLSKFANYFSKQYTRNLLLFIDRNKSIESFKSLRYDELIIMDDKFLEIIDKQLREINQNSAECPEVTEAPAIAEQLVINKIEIENESAIRSSQSGIRLRRKKLQLLRGVTAEQQPQSAFYDYKNFYNEDFIIKQQPNEKNSDKKLSDNLSMSQKKSSLTQKKKLFTKLSFSQNVAAPSLRKEISQEQCKKFNKQEWESWQNVYCT